MLSYFQKILSAPTPSRIFVEFFPKPVYHVITWKIFKFNMFKLMENASQTIEFRHFYSCPLEKLFPKLFIMTSLVDENYPLAPRQHFFQTLFPSSRKGRKKLWLPWKIIKLRITRTLYHGWFWLNFNKNQVIGG